MRCERKLQLFCGEVLSLCESDLPGFWSGVLLVVLLVWLVVFVALFWGRGLVCVCLLLLEDLLTTTLVPISGQGSFLSLIDKALVYESEI